MHRAVYALSAALQIGGAAAVVAQFDIYSPWLYVGLTAFLGGLVLVNAGLVVSRSRTLEEEFNAGYRIGMRAGRRAAGKIVISLEGRRRHSGRVPKAPLGSVAGHRAPPGRAQAYPD